MIGESVHRGYTYPGALSSLTPIDPRTLTITRAYEFCANRFRKGFFSAKLGTRVALHIFCASVIKIEKLEQQVGFHTSDCFQNKPKPK